MATDNSKEALKQLRQERKVYIDRARASMKQQKKQMSAIKSEIADAGKTIPEIAASLRMETDRVLLFVSALRSYGEVVEDCKEGDYFKYRLAAENSA